MGSSQRLAAAAAVSHARRYYNHTQPVVIETGSTSFNANVFFVSATLCGVLVAVCAVCWRKSPASDKPEDVTECHGVYTVSGDSRLHQEQMEMPGPPPAYESVVDQPALDKDNHNLSEVVTEPCPKCDVGGRCNNGLPTYEAAVMLKDTKL